MAPIRGTDHQGSDAGAAIATGVPDDVVKGSRDSALLTGVAEGSSGAVAAGAAAGAPSDLLGGSSASSSSSRSSRGGLPSQMRFLRCCIQASRTKEYSSTAASLTNSCASSASARRITNVAP